MPGPDKIASLDDGIRLSEQRTIRSSCYRRRRDRLSEFSRRRLALMESLLFSEGRRISDCGPADLMYPEAQFRCSQGLLCYHFSKAARKFILTHFELVEGGGGERRLLPALAGGRARFWANQACDGSIAARLARFFVETFAYSNWILDPGTPVRTRARLSLMDSIRSLFDRKPTREVLCDVINVHWVLVNSAPNATVNLPEWSLLHRRVKIREQLENPFARAIFAGEALCQLGSAIVGNGYEGDLNDGPPGLRHYIDGGPRRAWSKKDDAIIGAIGGIGGADQVSGLVGQYLCYSHLKNHPLGAGRMHPLLGSELTLRLATVVAAQAREALTVEAGIPEEIRSARMRTMMRKYSLLSEFARLSSSSLPASLAIDYGFNSYVDRDEPVQCSDTFRIVLDFGSSSWLIAERFSVSRPADRAPAPVESGLQRLRSLAREILYGRVGP